MLRLIPHLFLLLPPSPEQFKPCQRDMQQTCRACKCTSRKETYSDMEHKQPSLWAAKQHDNLWSKTFLLPLVYASWRSWTVVSQRNRGVFHGGLMSEVLWELCIHNLSGVNAPPPLLSCSYWPVTSEPWDLSLSKQYFSAAPSSLKQQQVLMNGRRLGRSSEPHISISKWILNWLTPQSVILWNTAFTKQPEPF